MKISYDEALEIIGEQSTGNNNEGKVKDMFEYKALKQTLTELEELKRYPTADEVCVALSEFSKISVYYEYGNFLYRKERFYNQPFLVATKYKSGLIEMTKNVLPPHIITLIGRFYEGLEKVGAKDV